MYDNKNILFQAFPYVTIDLGQSYRINNIVLWSRDTLHDYGKSMIDVDCKFCTDPVVNDIHRLPHILKFFNSSSSSEANMS